jgi:hypothetical protein
MTSMLPELNLADNIGIRESKLPREAILDTTPASSLPATKKIVNLVPITNNSVGANQTVQFLIPQRNLAKSHSFYLKFKFSLQGAAAYNTGAYDTGVNYLAPSDRFYSFAGSSGSAGALFQQMTVQAGGTTIEACQNYHLWHNNVICHAQDQNAAAKVESITAGSYLADLPWAKQVRANQPSAGTVPATLTAGTGGDLPGIDKFDFTNQFSAQATDSPGGAMTLSIPLQMGFFNPKEAQFLPLFAFNGGVLLTLQTNAIQKALFWSSSQFNATGAPLNPPLRDDGVIAGGGPTVSGAGPFNLCSDYLLSDFELCYTEITPAPAYIASTQAALQAGRQIRIECQSYNQYNVACNSSVRQNFNANMSSLAAIFWGRVNGIDSLTTKKWFQGQLGINDADPQQRYEVYLDNVQLFQSPNQLNMISVVARQLQEALCSSITDHPVSPYVQGGGYSAGDGYGIGTYISQAYLYGLSTKLFASNSTSFDGTQVSTITLNFQTNNDSTNNTWYLYLVYDYIYMVDATGSVSKLM